MVIKIVLIVCVCCYLVLAVVGYGILWARNRYKLSPPGPIIDFHHPDGGIRPKPIESFCALSIAGLIVDHSDCLILRSLSLSYLGFFRIIRINISPTLTVRV
ncbi:hypothetical protein BCR41DRAFT_362986 [Lobosporangium transversale]|uniref:Uncharacterized protein n=1 Tax=Lobosporangium transversale TaxID=64571 RepID=A0A1Y2GAY0_9FUNG|nr:hypothetical protein BCR41DRAFT_362986 [Lobosporangium transversale]ORZ04172.1 hypothetical protein BCR41DRAFT_362986 [Lobosporangium transversale]|eukprot:XP_021876386.1 hypothetical protein BCR41DRAFT_362986 [Lobosporangium transversale]